MKKFTRGKAKSFAYLLTTVLAFFTLFGIIFAFRFYAFDAVYACEHYKFYCCDSDRCKGNCHGIADPNVDTIAKCRYFCQYQWSGVGGKYCCPDCLDQCQVDSDCGSGCTCLADPNGNYCYCPGGGGGSGGGGGGNTNHPPTCTISFPTDGLGTVLYDAKEYYNINGSAVVKQPTTRTGKINTTDPDGDTVTLQSLTVDRNCAQPSLRGTNFTLTPQGHATGVSPVDLVSRRARGSSRNCIYPCEVALRRL